MKNYIKTMREMIGQKPLMMCAGSVILYKDGKVLLQKRVDNGLWGFHGGSMELGETSLEAAKRELFEETNLTANNLTLFSVYSGENLHYTYPNGDEVYIIDIVYLCDDFSGEAKCQTTEVSELKWFDIADIPTDLMPSAIPSLRDFVNNFVKM